MSKLCSSNVKKISISLVHPNGDEPSLCRMDFHSVHVNQINSFFFSLFFLIDEFRQQKPCEWSEPRYQCSNPSPPHPLRVCRCKPQMFLHTKKPTMKNNVTFYNMFASNKISCNGYERNTITHPPKRGSSISTSILLPKKTNTIKNKIKKEATHAPHSLLEFVIRLTVVLFLFSAKTSFCKSRARAKTLYKILYCIYGHAL